MAKKYISYLGVLVLACFSFYYTDRAVDIVKRNDPIMKSILAHSKDYTLDSVNATISNDEITSGRNGKKVNVDKSYQNRCTGGIARSGVLCFKCMYSNCYKQFRL